MDSKNNKLVILLLVVLMGSVLVKANDDWIGNWGKNKNNKECYKKCLVMCQNQRSQDLSYDATVCPPMSPKQHEFSNCIDKCDGA